MLNPVADQQTLILARHDERRAALLRSAYSAACHHFNSRHSEALDRVVFQRFMHLCFVEIAIPQGEFARRHNTTKHKVRAWTRNGSRLSRIVTSMKPQQRIKHMDEAYHFAVRTLKAKGSTKAFAVTPVHVVRELEDTAVMVKNQTLETLDDLYRVTAPQFDSDQPQADDQIVFGNFLRFALRTAGSHLSGFVRAHRLQRGQVFEWTQRTGKIALTGNRRLSAVRRSAYITNAYAYARNRLRAML